MNAIPTRYKHVLFRSRLESQWARFFDACNVRWEYEPECYQLETVTYLPDFLLGDPGERNIHIEVKPEALSHEQVADVMVKCTEFGKHIGVIAILAGNPITHGILFFGLKGTEHQSFRWSKCAACGGLGWYCAQTEMCIQGWCAPDCRGDFGDRFVHSIGTEANEAVR